MMNCNSLKLHFTGPISEYQISDNDKNIKENECKIADQEAHERRGASAGEKKNSAVMADYKHGIFFNSEFS